MDEKMRVIGRKMGIRMGILMSLCLSLVGTLTSGHFTVPGFLLSFVVSSVISLIIGFVVPLGKIGAGACKKAGLKQGSMGARLLESFISDLIYTPLITLAMVFMAYSLAMRMSGGNAQLNFGRMFLGSLLICFVVAYVLIFIFQPIFLKQLLKKEGNSH
ncbi:MAG: hypothetical protein K6G10_05425 [Butyrivibrio sp.]|nr:hypothetical protein [Butyrivibrio sp.]